SSRREEIMPMNVILLERVPKLGQMGDVVKVKPGFARNYLLPQKKALRATKDNIAYFESQRKVLEAHNLERRTEAEAAGGKLKAKPLKPRPARPPKQKIKKRNRPTGARFSPTNACPQRQAFSFGRRRNSALQPNLRLREGLTFKAKLWNYPGQLAFPIAPGVN